MGQDLLGDCFIGPLEAKQTTRLNNCMVTLTNRAVEYLKSVCPNDNYVTLGVKSGGCSGFTYVWDFKSNWPDVVWSDPIDDVLVLDPLAEMYILGSEIDYVEELGGSFLSIKNPSSTNSCGCGESFGV